MTNSTIAGSFKNNKAWHILLLIILPLLIYIQAIHFDYTNFDDNRIICDKFALVGNIKTIPSVINQDAFFNRNGSFYRPVQNISFILDAQVSGKKLWMFHLTNLILHILTCIALYFFLQLVSLKRLAAFYMALLFAVHPLFASDIGWVPARGDVLIGLQGLLLFISFYHYFNSYKRSWLLLHAIVFFPTIFTKELALFFPPLLVCYYFLLLNGASDNKLVNSSIKKLLPFVVLWAIPIALFLCMRRSITAGVNISNTIGLIPFLKNCASIPIILGKFFMPLYLSTLPLFDIGSIITGIFFLLLLLFIVYKYSIQKKWIVLFGFLWFVLFAIPPTLYRLPNTDLFFNYLEHRSYLPMIGITIIIGFFINIRIAFSTYFKVVYIPVIILLSSLAYLHCADYKNTLTLAASAARFNNPSAFAARAGYKLSIGDTTGTIADCRKAIALMKGIPTAAVFNNLGQAYSGLNMPDSAFVNFNKAIKTYPNFAYAYFQRGNARFKFKDTAGARKDWNEATRLGYANAGEMPGNYSHLPISQNN